MRIFIDANIYLDFYRVRSVRSLLKTLESVKDKIFIPKQVCDEVIRHRAKIACQRLKEDIDKISINIVDFPDFPDLLIELALDNNDSNLQQECSNLKEQSRSLENDGKDLKEKYKDVLEEAFCHVAEGSDSISKTLQVIFANPSSHNEEQLKNARLRKELGNPPGKSNGSLGDQLVWEQIISTINIKQEEDIWIVSRDSDYFVEFCDKIVLNPYLYEEFAKKRSGKVFVFKDLATALQHYKDHAAPQLELPSDEVLDLAKKEQRGFAKQSKCNCPEGPTPFGKYENRFYIVRCEKCGVILAMQEDSLFLDD